MRPRLRVACDPLDQRAPAGPDPWEPGPRGEGTTPALERHNRSRVEVLRDLLEAAELDRAKTRLIGRANLNEESFGRYSALALSEGLLVRAEGGYAPTPKGEAWLHAADVALARQQELIAALEQLSRIADLDAGWLGSPAEGVGTPTTRRSVEPATVAALPRSAGPGEDRLRTVPSLSFLTRRWPRRLAPAARSPGELPYDPNPIGSPDGPRRRR